MCKKILDFILRRLNFIPKRVSKTFWAFKTFWGFFDGKHFRLVGFLSFDINVTDFDIDQCNKEGGEEDDASAEPSENGGPRQRNQISYFSETHKCHRETSQVRQCNKVFGNVENIAKRVTGKTGLE